jgi:hypothetical protein
MLDIVKVAEIAQVFCQVLGLWQRVGSLGGWH